MRRRLFTSAAILLAIGVAVPTLARADGSAAATTATTHSVAMRTDVAPSWCAETFLNPGQCLVIPCPIAKYCPEVGVAGEAAAVAAAPRFLCAPEIAIACEVVGTVLCTKPFKCPLAGATAAPAATPRAPSPPSSAPAIACAPGFEVLCTVLGVVCRSRCETVPAAGAGAVETPAVTRFATHP